MQLRAPKVMTMDGPILNDHCIGIEDGRISYLLPISEAPRDAEVIDLPNTTLLPGFVNAHCHMDLSHLRGKVSYTGSFTEWIQKIVTLRQHLAKADVQAAARELIASGVTAVMDHVGSQSELAYIIDTPFRKRLFMEVIGVKPEVAAACLQTQGERALEAQRQGVVATPSPHAPYSLCVEGFGTIIKSSCRTGSGIQSDDHSGSRLEAGMTNSFSIHCAESVEEWEMFTEGRGKLWEFVRGLRETLPLCKGEPVGLAVLPRREVPEEDKGESVGVEFSTSPNPSLQRRGIISYLSNHNLLPHSPWLAVHCNTLTDDDIVLLKKSQATVVHCPRSHRYFNHPPFPLEKLRAAGVPVAIGTDSLASCPNFNFLEELRALREEFAFLGTEEILGMATARHPGLRAGVHSEVHSGCRIKSGMTNGAFADIIGLPQQNDLLNGPITFSMIGGRRVI